MPDNSFDVVSKIELPEVSNAVQQVFRNDFPGWNVGFTIGVELAPDKALERAVAAESKAPSRPGR